MGPIKPPTFQYTPNDGMVSISIYITTELCEELEELCKKHNIDFSRLSSVNMNSSSYYLSGRPYDLYEIQMFVKAEKSMLREKRLQEQNLKDYLKPHRMRRIYRKLKSYLS